MHRKAKSSKYWNERFRQLEAAQNQKGIDACWEIEWIYRRAQKEIDEKIRAWHQRFAANNGISMAEARKMLSGSDLAEFKWDVEDYIRYGQENALLGGWGKELENASAKFHISRLEALKIHTQHSLEVLFEKQFGIVRGAMADVLQSGYFHTAYELQKGFGVGWDIVGLDQKHIEKILSRPWAVDGKNFSERIWGNKKKLISEVHKELSQNVILGRDPQRAIDAIAKKMNVSKHNAGRLVMTEEAYFSSAAQRDCFRQLGVKQYKIVATLDSHTSDICRSLDGKHFFMKDFQAGVTAPPFHVRCRSTTAPYFEEDFGVIGERAAREEETGRTYFVPNDMKYPEWKRIFVDNGEQSVLLREQKIAEKRIRDAKLTFYRMLAKKKPTRYADKMMLYCETAAYQLNSGLSVPFVYHAEADVMQYNAFAPDFDLYDLNFVQAHELSHRMDMLEYRSWENETFLRAIENSRKKLYNNKKEVSEWFSAGGKYENDMALSDICSALSEGEWNDILYGGHLAEYWKEDGKNVPLEIFANIAGIDILDYDSKAEFDGFLKELYDAYRGLVE